jgi:hypothetical protein
LTLRHLFAPGGQAASRFQVPEELIPFFPVVGNRESRLSQPLEPTATCTSIMSDPGSSSSIR